MSVKKIIVQSSEPVRLDRYLKRVFSHITQGVIESYLRKGKIKLNDKRKVHSSERVITGDEITLFTDFTNVVNAHDLPKVFLDSTISLARKLLGEYLLFSCEEFIAINKPENLAVQGGSKIQLSIAEAISYLNSINGTSLKLVHRLDKGTSGILLIACGYENANKLCKAFEKKIIQKTYLALVCGSPREPEGTIINYIGKDKSGIFECVKPLENGKKAETYYKIIQRRKDHTWVEFKPVTGRMHQLRVHSNILGCPILGDAKYGGQKYTRLMLHATRVSIHEEVFGRAFAIECDLPDGW